MISEGKVSLDADKVKTINDWPNPRNIKQIQQFLGLAGYYRKFILHFAHIAQPLYNLTKKDVVWKWDSSCQEAFNNLKKLLTSEPILRMPDFTRPFYIYCDASGVAVGAVLCQKDENNIEYVIMYISGLLHGA